MFLNMPILKKLIKSAFNSSGLTVAHVHDGYVAAGAAWAAWLEIGNIPAKVKGAIVELAGELPEPGQAYKATKEGLQYEMPVSSMLDVKNSYMQAKVPYTKVPLIYTAEYYRNQLYQADGSREFTSICEPYCSIIDIREINHNVEGMPSGPCAHSEKGAPMLYWKNETCALGLCCSRPTDGMSAEIMGQLKEIDFSVLRDKGGNY